LQYIFKLKLPAQVLTRHWEYESVFTLPVFALQAFFFPMEAAM